MTSFYSEEELQELGFAHVGKHVQLSRKTSIYGAEHIWIGDYVRIDDFCVLSGKITFAGHNHIAVYSAIFGGAAGVEFELFSGLSSRVCVYAVNDDYSGNALMNPTIPDKYKNVTEKPVIFKKYSVIGSTAVVLPGVTIGEGCAVGAMSLVNRSLKPWSVCTGSPAKERKERSRDMIGLSEKLLEEERYQEQMELL